MSSMPHPGPPAAPSAPTESNGLGIASFVVSLVGFFATGGLLCPVGLVLGLVALGRRPRGFAIAGVVIGLLGSCGVIAIGIGILAIGFAALAVLIAATVAGKDEINLAVSMAAVAGEVASYTSEEGGLPADLDALGLDPGLTTDPWGTPLRFTMIEAAPGYDLFSAGPDQAFETDDDIAFSRIGELFGIENGSVQVEGRENGGRVRITAGKLELLITGDDDGGEVTVIRDGNELIRVGDMKRDGPWNDAGSGASTPAPAIPTTPAIGDAPPVSEDIPLGGGGGEPAAPAAPAAAPDPSGAPGEG